MAVSLSVYSELPLAGINFKERYVPSLERPRGLELGTMAIGNQNDTWLFVQSDVVIAAGNAVLLVNTATPGPTLWHITNAATGTNFTADVGFAIGEVGWIHLTNTPFD